MNKKLITILILLVISTLCVISSIPVIAVSFSIVEVVGSSMERNFHNGDKCIVINLVSIDTIQNHDAIIYKNPSAIDRMVISRIVGIPQDKLEISEYGITVNEFRADEWYTNGITTGDYTYLNVKGDTFRLAPDEFFVMGDNRNNSLDSREFGPISPEDIVGEVLFCY